MLQMNPHRTWLLWGWSKRDWSHNLDSTLYFWNILYGARLSWVHSRSLFSSGHLADQSLGFSECRFLILCPHPRIIHHPRVWAAPGQCQGIRYCLVGQEIRTGVEAWAAVRDSSYFKSRNCCHPNFIPRESQPKQNIWNPVLLFMINLREIPQLLWAMTSLSLQGEQWASQGLHEDKMRRWRRK